MNTVGNVEQEVVSLFRSVFQTPVHIAPVAEKSDELSFAPPVAFRIFRERCVHEGAAAQQTAFSLHGHLVQFAFIEQQSGVVVPSAGSRRGKPETAAQHGSESLFSRHCGKFDRELLVFLVRRECPAGMGMERDECSVGFPAGRRRFLPGFGAPHGVDIQILQEQDCNVRHMQGGIPVRVVVVPEPEAVDEFERVSAPPEQIRDVQVIGVSLLPGSQDAAIEIFRIAVSEKHQKSASAPPCAAGIFRSAFQIHAAAQQPLLPGVCLFRQAGPVEVHSEGVVPASGGVPDPCVEAQNGPLVHARNRQGKWNFLRVFLPGPGEFEVFRMAEDRCAFQSGCREHASRQNRKQKCLQMFHSSPFSDLMILRIILSAAAG